MIKTWREVILGGDGAKHPFSVVCAMVPPRPGSAGSSQDQAAIGAASLWPYDLRRAQVVSRTTSSVSMMRDSPATPLPRMRSSRRLAAEYPIR